MSELFPGFIAQRVRHFRRGDPFRNGRQRAAAAAAARISADARDVAQGGARARAIRSPSCAPTFAATAIRRSRRATPTTRRTPSARWRWTWSRSCARSASRASRSRATTAAARVAHRLCIDHPRRVSAGRAARHLADAPHVRADGLRRSPSLLPLVLPDPALRHARADDRRRSRVLPAAQDGKLGIGQRVLRSRARSPSTSAATASRRRSTRHARTIARRRRSTSRTTTSTSRRAARLRARCSSCGARRASCTNASIRSTIGEAWRRTCADAPCRRAITSPRRRRRRRCAEFRRFFGVGAARGAASPICYNRSLGQVAQLVEQRTENPCVGGSIPPLATRSMICSGELPTVIPRRDDAGRMPCRSIQGVTAAHKNAVRTCCANKSGLRR